MGKIYAYPKLSSAGLGNLLLPWGRCEIFARQHQLPVLAPQWTMPKIGPLLRGERDKRYYVGLFDHSGYVGGLKRQLLLWNAERIAESAGSTLMRNRATMNSSRPAVIQFEGLGEFFKPLLPHHEFLRTRLAEILSRRSRQKLMTGGTDFVVGVHVRRGDKQTLAYREISPDHARTPSDEWFIRCIEGIRRIIGSHAKVILFSDANRRTLSRLLALPNTELAPSNPSIVDILLLAKSQVLVTTGRSTFSMWASFLGRMPTIWYPETFNMLTPDQPQIQVETDLEGNLPAAFEEVLRRRI